jgi:hypothetical protein
MTTSKVISITAAKPPRQEDPVDIINDRLGEARATLDLIQSGLTDPDFVDSLFNDTLAHAVHGVIQRIEEAMAAAETMWQKAVHS